MALQSALAVMDSLVLLVDKTRFISILFSKSGLFSVVFSPPLVQIDLSKGLCVV